MKDMRPNECKPNEPRSAQNAEQPAYPDMSGSNDSLSVATAF